MTSTPTIPMRPAESPRGSAVSTQAQQPAASPTTSFIKTHAVAMYFVLAFAISWGGLLIVYGPGGLTSSAWQSDPRSTLIGVALLAGPSAAGILLIGIVSGRAGYRELLARLTRWRVGLRWYAVALLATPLLAAATNFTLSLVSPVFTPAIASADDKASLVLSGIATGLFIGIFEELGWTGFAIPRLRMRHSVLSTGLLLGFVWGAWHILPNLESDSFAAALPLAMLLTRVFSWLSPFRVLMVWVYERTASLLLAMLMHASLVAGWLVIFAAPGVDTVGDWLTVMLAWAAVLWALVALLVLSMRRVVHAAA